MKRIDPPMLVEPGSLGAVQREGDEYVGVSGQRYAIENGIVRMLKHVDPDLARELEVQDVALALYSDPRLLMPRYEQDMARLAVLEMFGGKPPTGMVLDAGCGIGLLGSMFPDLGLVGLDASFTLLKTAKVGYAMLVEASAEALPFPDASFDTVIALNMLHHVIRPDAAVCEFARVLRPNGRLIALDPRRVFPVELAKRVLRGRDPAFAPTHKAFGVAEYHAIIRQQGRFHVEDARRVGLLSLLAMAGLDALGWSRWFKNPQTVVDALRGADRWLFRVPGLERAGLNLAVLGVRKG
jgi:SAM-dependent methyltransferase